MRDKLIPKLFNFDQRQIRMNMVRMLLDEIVDDLRVIKQVITGDIDFKPKSNGSTRS